MSLSSFKVPGAGLGITWPSGLCPQRSRFRPTLPGPKDRSLSSRGESVAWLPPLHPILGLQPGGSVLCLLPCCGPGPAFDSRPALLQSHWNLPHLTSPSIGLSYNPGARHNCRSPVMGPDPRAFRPQLGACMALRVLSCAPESSCDPSLPTQIPESPSFRLASTWPVDCFTAARDSGGLSTHLVGLSIQG